MTTRTKSCVLKSLFGRSRKALRLPVRGMSDSRWRFRGHFVLERIVARRGYLFAIGQLSGVLIDSRGLMQMVLEKHPFTFPARKEPQATGQTRYELGPLRFEMLDVDLELGPVHLVVKKPAPTRIQRAVHSGKRLVSHLHLPWLRGNSPRAGAHPDVRNSREIRAVHPE
jgi:hypothetical protein